MARPKKIKDAPAVGAPTKYRDEYAHICNAMAVKGFLDDEMAQALGVARSTFYKWKSEIPEFSDAIKAGKAIADDRVVRSLYEKATGYEHEAVKVFMPANAKKPVIVRYKETALPDVTAQIFILKNRRPSEWRDRQEVSLDGSLDITAMTDEQLDARLAELLAKMKS